MSTCMKRGATGTLISGIVLVSIGAVLLLDQFGLVDARSLWHFWPAIFIISGIVKVSSSSYSSPRIWGGFLILFGIILTLHEFGRFPWSDMLGPWGVVMTSNSDDLEKALQQNLKLRRELGA